MVRMLVFSHVSNTNSITGAEKLLLFFCMQMSTFFECTLVVPNEGKLTHQARKQGITVMMLPLTLAYEMYTPGAGLLHNVELLKETQEYESLKQLIHNQSPDLILTNTCVHILPAMAAKELKIPIIWKITEIMADNKFTPISVSLIDRYSDWIITISEAVAHCFPLEVRQSKMSVLYPSLDEEQLHSNTWPELRQLKRNSLKLNNSHKLVGYISSFINREKGLDHFIDMALKVSEIEPKARFLIIGSAVDDGFLRHCLRKIKESGNIKRFSFIPYEESVQSAYCAMDVVVVPSMVREGFGMTALEGLIFGKPVVAFSSGGLREILEMAGMADYLVEPGDTEAMVSKVCQLLASDDLGASLGMRSQQSVRMAFGTETYQQRLQLMIARWLQQFPGWFLLHQAPEASLMQVNNEEAQQVIVENANQVSRNELKSTKKRPRKVQSRRKKRRKRQMEIRLKKRGKSKVKKVRVKKKKRNK